MGFASTFGFADEGLLLDAWRIDWQTLEFTARRGLHKRPVCGSRNRGIVVEDIFIAVCTVGRIEELSSLGRMCNF